MKDTKDCITRISEWERGYSWNCDNTGEPQTAKDYNTLIKEWEYCYCVNCDCIRYSAELTVTEQGIKCSVCGSYDLEAPAWVNCPQEWKNEAIKCPRGGSGIRKGPNGEDKCIYCCTFRHT